MCMSSDENVRSNRKPFIRNNEHDYSTWNIMTDDYDIDLSEYLIDTKEETIGSSLLTEDEITQTPAIDDTQNFDAPAPLKKSRRYSCPVCKKLWVSFKDYLGGQSQLKRAFQITPSKLKRHMSVHRNEKYIKELPRTEQKKSYESPKKEPEVQCPICFLAIDSQAELIQHMTIHIKIDPSTVPLAQKIGKKYICTVCDSESNSTAKLQSHMKSHMRKSLLVPIFNGSIKKPSHVCPYCSQSCFNSASLQRHINTHIQSKKLKRRSRPRNHACQHCEKRFETPSKLLRHQTVHRDILQGMKDNLIESPLEISTVTSILGD